MSLILKNRTTFNSLYELDPSCFTKQNVKTEQLNKTYVGAAAEAAAAPVGVLGGTVAALKAGESYTVVPADGTNTPIGLFVNDALGNPFDNAPAVAANKIAIAQKLASVEVDVYADVTFEIGQLLYSDANGYLTNARSTDGRAIGLVTKLPTVSDPFLGLEMLI